MQQHQGILHRFATLFGSDIMKDKWKETILRKVMIKTTTFLALVVFAVSSSVAPEPEEKSPQQMPDFSAMVKGLADNDIGVHLYQ